MEINEYLQLTNDEKEQFFNEICKSNSRVRDTTRYIVAIRKRNFQYVKKPGERQNAPGRLTFVEELKRKDIENRKIYYLCKCDCGKWTIIRSDEFKDITHTMSCGCYHNEINKQLGQDRIGKYFKDITGQIFGDLQAIETIYETNQNGSYKWIYKCTKCGHEVIAALETLQDTRCAHACPNCKTGQSAGEKAIKTILDENNIPYETEKTFNTCRFKDTNYLARFDFYVNNAYLIEFDGKQHFQACGFGRNTEEIQKDFLKTKEHDIYKTNWCKENNIQLIRIPYTHLNELSIKDLLLSTSNFIC